MRGHVGTELLNACSEVWQIKKTEDLFQAELIENRNEPSRLINFGFRFNDEGLPVLVDSEPTLSRSEQTYQRKIECLYFCLKPGVRLCYKSLTEEFCEVYGCAKPTAERTISTFLTNGYLLKDDGSKEYRFNSEKVPMINQNQPTSHSP